MVPGEQKGKGAEKLFDTIIAGNFPNLGKKIDIQVQEVQSPKQEQTKEVDTKTPCNLNGKN